MNKIFGRFFHKILEKALKIKWRFCTHAFSREQIVCIQDSFPLL